MIKQLLGVVFCGGQSKRMGSDKGLLLQNNKTWAQLAVEKFEALRILFCISIHAGQSEAYQKLFKEDLLVTDNQNLGGPMNGLLSVHEKYPAHDLLLLACDMTDMQVEILENLVMAYSTNNSFDFYAYEVENVVQPFCAVYTAKAVKDLMQKKEQDILTSSSLRYTIEHGNTLKLQTKYVAAFTNYNTLDERKR